MAVRRLRKYWTASLVLFVVAVCTGVLYRAGQAYGFTGGLDMVNIRHAHSHTMYFGWVTPVLFLFIGLRVGIQGLGRLLAWVIGASALAYVLFLFFGYRPVAIGPVTMPVSVVAATLNTIIWYVFAAAYFRTRDAADRSPPHQLWDASLAFLLLATIGALGLAFLKPLGLDDPVWSMALTHLFLDLFSEGWFVLGVLGIAFGRFGFHNASRLFQAGLLLVVVGLPFTFAMGMPQGLVAEPLQWLARAGSLFVGCGLLLLAALLWLRIPWRSAWFIPLTFLTLKALGQATAALGIGFWPADHHGFRILYLHVMLLGFVSCVLVAEARAALGVVSDRGLKLFLAAVTAVILSLVPLAGIVPAEQWMYTTATWVAILPAVAGAYLVVAGARGGEWTYHGVNSGSDEG
ncbi:MAG: hypothetical protein WD021_09805 [Rhodothermales bacterium]